MSDQQPPDDQIDPTQISEEQESETKLSDVLLSAPHHLTCRVKIDAVLRFSSTRLPRLPVLSDFCSTCGNTTYFDGKWAHALTVPKEFAPTPTDQTNAACTSSENQVAIYRCRNCLKQAVSMALRIEPGQGGFASCKLATVLKVGQFPDYAPRAPKRLQDFLAKDKDDLELFRKGWRCENRGEGIAAFAYYRRVVEDSWARLLGRLLDAVKKLGDTESAELLENSKGQWHFSQAVKDVPSALPKRLRIGGANPFLVLHDAFSVGVHSVSDAQCLSIATAGRKLLVELISGMDEALKDDSEMKTAVADLQKFVTKHRS